MAGWTQKLKLHHLQMLVALGEQGNLTQVAKMMNITQPALSKWLSQFEDEVGMPLFERHSKGLRPTEGGKLLLQHAQRLINDMSRSQYEIERFKQGGQVGSLMIGCSPVATDCVSQAILELLKEMPTLHLNIEEKVMTFSSILRCRVGISLSSSRIACETQSVATGEQPIIRLPTCPPCLKRSISYCERDISLISRWAC